MALIWKRRITEVFGPAFKWVIDGFRDEESNDFQTVKLAASNIVNGAEKTATVAVKSGEDFQTFREAYNKHEMLKTSQLPVIWRQLAKNHPVLKWLYISAYFGGSVFAFLSNIIFAGNSSDLGLQLFTLGLGLAIGFTGFLIYRLSLYCLTVAEFSHWFTSLIFKSMSIPAIVISAPLYALLTLSNIITPCFAIIGLFASAPMLFPN
jgi:hypothetical protein